MSNFIALAVLALLTAIPVAAVIAAYREEFEPARDAARRFLAFDPRHPGLTYDAANRRIEQPR